MLKGAILNKFIYYILLIIIYTYLKKRCREKKHKPINDSTR